MFANNGVGNGYNGESLHDEIKFNVNSSFQNHVCIFRRVASLERGTTVLPIILMEKEKGGGLHTFHWKRYMN